MDHGWYISDVSLRLKSNAAEVVITCAYSVCHESFRPLLLYFHIKDGIIYSIWEAKSRSGVLPKQYLTIRTC